MYIYIYVCVLQDTMHTHMQTMRFARMFDAIPYIALHDTTVHYCMRHCCINSLQDTCVHTCMHARVHTHACAHACVQSQRAQARTRNSVADMNGAEREFCEMRVWALCPLSQKIVSSKNGSGWQSAC